MAIHRFVVERNGVYLAGCEDGAVMFTPNAARATRFDDVPAATEAIFELPANLQNGCVVRDA